MMKYISKTFTFILVATVLTACSSGTETYFTGNDYVKRNEVVAETSEGTFNISYLTSGSAGRRVIFVHGTPGAAQDYYRLIRNAPADIEYLVIDRPGYGETKPNKLVASLETQADVLAPLLIEKNGQKPILVGHSSGGPIAAMAAMRHSDKIGGLLLASSSLDPELEPDPLFVQKLGNAPVISWFVPKELKIINKELLALPKQLETMGPQLGTITAPTIIMHGTADLLVPYGNVAYLEKHLTGTSYRETIAVKGLGHEVPWQREVMFSKAIRKLVDESYDIATSNIKVDRRHWLLQSQSREELRDPQNRAEK
ncbi:alpha/beta fold hydrolase [Kordiimonas sp. SCSIO 12610]|uniref:alpha/beta fold hydrolase n=1 Tax=Kordiimonas sp. SCSIO 12610 TaxID=2829597 RepID=UPI002108FB57|nr:alpha/beta hydrolase [Kordiimonas sp. SCSIO 12610]UTW55656.1 alpha/beta hydrolase [Kordiimonas sp. SCSIO 12610]